MLVAGRHFDHAEGAGLVQKIVNLKGFSPEAFAEAHNTSPHFVATMKPGTVLCIPVGYITTKWARGDAEVLKWNW